MEATEKTPAVRVRRLLGTRSGTLAMSTSRACGVATTVPVPSATVIRASSSASSSVRGPSSTPGRMWKWSSARTLSA